jgi:hypothetical protein
MTSGLGRFLASVVVALFALGAAASAQRRPTITLDNQSGADALVRLAGPTSGMVDVPDRSRETVQVRGGTYQLFVRYGRDGRYRYTRGEAFTVEESARSVDHITITLHLVEDGNYETDPSDEAEFNGTRRPPAP